MFPRILFTFFTGWTLKALVHEAQNNSAQGIWHRVRALNETHLCFSPIDNPLECVAVTTASSDPWGATVRSWPQGVWAFTLDEENEKTPQERANWVMKVAQTYYGWGIAPQQLMWIAPPHAFTSGDVTLLDLSPWKGVRVVSSGLPPSETPRPPSGAVLPWGTVSTHDSPTWWSPTSEPKAAAAAKHSCTTLPVQGCFWWPHPRDPQIPSESSQEEDSEKGVNMGAAYSHPQGRLLW